MMKVERTRRLSLHPNQTTVTLGSKIAAVIALTIALFSQDLMIVFNDAWNSEITSYMLLIPFFLGYLIYRKRKILRAVMPLDNKDQPKETRHLPFLGGILLCLTAVLVYWYGSYTFTPLEYHMVALPVFVAGLSLALFNLQTLRQLAFPIVLLLFLMPPVEMLYSYGSFLSSTSTDAANAFANAIGVNSTIVTEYGNPSVLISRPDGYISHLTVTAACSGIYSLIGFFVFATLIAYIIRDKLWKRLTLFVIGMPLIYSLNLVRLTTIFAADYYLGEDTALQVFHVFGGWVLIFLGTILLLLISEKGFKTKIFTSSKANCLDCSSHNKPEQSLCYSCGRIFSPKPSVLQKSDLVKIGTAILAISLLVYIQAPVFALTRASPLPSGDQVPMEVFPQEIAGYDLVFLYRDFDFEALAKQDMSLMYMYVPSDANSTKEPVYVALEIASSLSSLHRWEVCLIEWRLAHGEEPGVNELERTDVLLCQNPPVVSRFFAFNYTATGETQAVLYWFETAAFTINSTSQQKRVKISLIIDYPDDLSGAKKNLEEVGTAIIDYRQPIKTWSKISLLISENGSTLAATSIAALVIVSSLYVAETRKQKKANSNAYQKMSPEGKQLIDAVKATQKRTTAILANILADYRPIIGKPVEKDELLQRLSRIAESGIIENRIANVNDEPIQTWKARLC